MIIGKTYPFRKLEAFLSKKGNGIYLMVENTEYRQRAVMHIFKGNFCGDWLSGDGVLFYSDGEVHSANPDDEFKQIAIQKI